MKKTCGFCENTDGMCYTSNPPKRKCTITGKFHAYDHICDMPQTNADRIRSMTDEELAKHNVRDWLEFVGEYDKNGELKGNYQRCWRTSDGSIFWIYESAVEFELYRLKQPADKGVNNDTHN